MGDLGMTPAQAASALGHDDGGARIRKWLRAHTEQKNRTHWKISEEILEHLRHELPPRLHPRHITARRNPEQRNQRREELLRAVEAQLYRTDKQPPT